MLTDILLLVVGVIVGAMNSIAGGGMLIGFPVLLAVGMPALVANATANVILFPGQIASAYGYRDYLKKVPRQYLWLLLPCFVGAIFGALILRYTPATNFEKIVPNLILFAVVLFAFQPLLHFHVHKQLHASSSSNKPLIYIALATIPLAIYGGYFGAGFGFVMLAFLGYTKLNDIHIMNALKNLAAAAIALGSFAGLYSAHLINWRGGLAMAIGTSIGGYAGARLTQHISSRAIRIGVISIGLVTAVYLFLRPY